MIKTSSRFLYQKEYILMETSYAPKKIFISRLSPI